MVKYILFTAIILFANILHSQPSGVISNLMEAQVSQLSYGLDRCRDKIGEEESEINEILNNFAPDKNYELWFHNCHYKWDDNEIIIIIKIGERTSSNTVQPEPELSNEMCRIFLQNIRNKFVIKSGDKVWNLIVQEFGNDGFQTSLDNEIDLSLKDYIYLDVGVASGSKCKSKLDYDKEIFFFQ